MRANGVVIDETPPAPVMDALRGAAASVVEGWMSRVGPDARAVLVKYREKRAR